MPLGNHIETSHPGPGRVGPGQRGEDAHDRGLACLDGAQEAGDMTRVGGEGQVVDGGLAAEAFRQLSRLDHGVLLLSATWQY